jgi:hypothetical protein
MTRELTRLQALIELRDKVKAGGIVQPFLFQDVFNDQQSHENCAGEAYEAFNGSLDAAKALHEAVLPGWAVHRVGSRHGGVWEADLMQLDADGWHNAETCMRSKVWNADPARAWLLAILDALIAQEGQQ